MLATHRPPVEKSTLLVARVTAKLLKFIGQNSGGNRFPSIPVAQQYQKVRLGRESLATFDFAEAELHCLVVKLGLLVHSPPQVNGLEAGAT